MMRTGLVHGIWDRIARLLEWIGVRPQRAIINRQQPRRPRRVDPDLSQEAQAVLKEWLIQHEGNKIRPTQADREFINSLSEELVLELLVACSHFNLMDLYKLSAKTLASRHRESQLSILSRKSNRSNSRRN